MKSSPLLAAASDRQGEQLARGATRSKEMKGEASLTAVPLTVRGRLSGVTTIAIDWVACNRRRR